MTSKLGEKSVERVAADANVILSAIVGKAALRVFSRSELKIVSTAATLGEVREYLPSMAEAYGISPEILEGQFRLLVIKECAVQQYRRFLSKAARLIGKRDPDDVELLALALALGIPIWSNDRDFEVAGVECYTTARLLKKLGL